MSVQYCNTSPKLQVINTKKGRSLYVDSRSTVPLEDGEEDSPEIQVLVSRRRGKFVTEATKPPKGKKE